MNVITAEEMTMSMNLPKPIADYVEANARLDVDGMLRSWATPSLSTTASISKDRWQSAIC